MKFTKKMLSLEEGLKREWIITNGIGGFCSSTILGANTRKYHGLLIAPLNPPARRFLVLSKVDESIEIEGKENILYTNACRNYISDGYKNLVEFEKKYYPKFLYEIEDLTLEKTICMEYGKNTVCILYKIIGGRKTAKLKVAPIVNFRDFHSMSTNHKFDINQKITKNKVRIIVDKKSETPLYMNMSEGKYIEHKNDTFENMFYIEEQKRGFYPEENHSVVGRYEIEIQPNEEKEISFVFSLEENIEEINCRSVIENEEKRLKQIINDTGLVPKKRKEDLSKKEQEQKELLETYIIATDNFIVYRPNFGLHTIIAGYPWFLDWGRDSLISFEGLLLVTKRFELAKEILLTFIRDIKFGLVPNGYSGYDNRPLYNSVDSSLLLFEQVNKYLTYTLDYNFIKEKIYEKLVKIIDSYKNGIDLDDNNIFLDKDGLIVSGTENTQNTWMDVKYNGFAVTPRNGKAVEINAMWYNALKIMQELTIKFQGEADAIQYEEMAEKCKKSFIKKFYNKQKKCLYDVIGDEKIRPNQLFSMALTYPVLNLQSRMAKETFETVTKKLLMKHGLKTLAKGEKEYIDVYEGDSFKRDMSYHQGITWPWLLGVYNDSFRNLIKSEKSATNKKRLEEKYNEFVDNLKKTFNKDIINIGCIGSISELYDSKTPYLPKGTIAQAWSVAEIFRIIIGETIK